MKTIYDLKGIKEIEEYEVFFKLVNENGEFLIASKKDGMLLHEDHIYFSKIEYYKELNNRQIYIVYVYDKELGYEKFKFMNEDGSFIHNIWFTDLKHLYHNFYIAYTDITNTRFVILNISSLSLVYDENLYFKNIEIFSERLNPYIHIALLTRIDGLITIVNEDDMSFVHKDTWFSSIDILDKDLYIAKRSTDGLCTIIDRNSGEYRYMDFWYEGISKFYLNQLVDDLFFVKNAHQNWTLAKKCDGTLINKNAWYTNWYSFDIDTYKVEINGLYTLISKKTLEPVIKDILVKSISKCKSCNIYYKVTLQDETENLVKKSDGTLFFDFALDYNDEIIPSSNGNVILKTSNGVTLYNK